MKFAFLLWSGMFLLNNSWNLSPSGSEVYSTRDGKVALHFDLTIGQMEAHTQDVQSTLDVGTEAVIFTIQVKSFLFNNPILEKQFKNVYMEVDKFPETHFRGKIQGKIDFTTQAPQSTTVIGTLMMHGQSQPKEIPATFTLEGEQVRVVSQFPIRASEYGVTIPAAFFTHGKDEILVSIDVVYAKKS
ncbi:MAG: YceI family protein [Bacteroidia bacterium]|nr:YceI family protein [Bacteroidia bacterium]